jgi:thiopeptide-type bacteriocin biosynthesis protein
MEVQRTREKCRLPRFVWLQERPGRSGDPPLLIDLDNALCVKLLLRAAGRDPDLYLVEALPQPDAECARGPDGRYTHEIVLPLAISGPLVSPEARKLPEPRTRPGPGHPPGTRWLFAKLYTPTSSSDTLLCRVVAPLMRTVLRAGAVRRWFFVRYSDPDPHLRLYAFGPARRLIAHLLPVLSRTLQRSPADGATWRLQLDTYEPEVERYGGLEGTRVAERVFGFDTAATVALIERRPTRLERVRLVALGTDRLLDAVGASPSEKLTIVGGARDLAAEHLELDDVAARRRQGELFRRERLDLSNLLATGEAWPELGARDAAIRRAVAALGPLAAAGTLTRSRLGILADLAHMHANRVFATEQRASELLALDLLWRHYRAAATAAR